MTEPTIDPTPRADLLALLDEAADLLDLLSTTAFQDAAPRPAPEDRAATRAATEALIVKIMKVHR